MSEVRSHLTTRVPQFDGICVQPGGGFEFGVNTLAWLFLEVDEREIVLELELERLMPKK